MIKQICTDQLLPGMYIDDLNCGWLDHPFMTNAFAVHGQATVVKIVSLGIREVYIDTLKGADVWLARPQADVNAEMERRLHGEANKIVRVMMDDVRLGQQIRIVRIEPLVDIMVESISAIRTRCCRGAITTLIRSWCSLSFVPSASIQPGRWCGWKATAWVGYRAERRQTARAGGAGLLSRRQATLRPAGNRQSVQGAGSHRQLRELRQMENRSLSVLALLSGLLLMPLPVLADIGPDAQQTADWTQRLERASALQREGRRLQEVADQAFEAESKACFSRFQVTSCQQAAKKTHVAATRAARKLETEGSALERTVKKEQQADKAARREADAPRRQAELKAREAETAEARAAASQIAEARQADKARQAEEGARRKAADAERLRKKREEHEVKVARRMAEAERRAAEAKKP